MNSHTDTKVIPGIVEAVNFSGTTRTLNGKTVAKASTVTYTVGLNTEYGSTSVSGITPFQPRDGNAEIYPAEVGHPCICYVFGDDIRIQVLEVPTTEVCA